MKKIILALIFSCCVAVCFSFAGCSDEQEKIDFKSPQISDLVVDVSDRPEGIYLGDAKLKSLSLNGETVSLVEYLARNEWFIFTAEFYGEYGVGDFNYTFDFENFQSLNMKLSVKDEKSPDYSLPSSDFYAYSSGDTVELPSLVRNLMYQNYIAEYCLNKDGNTVFNSDDNGGNRLPIAHNLESGFYNYSVNVKKDGQILSRKDCEIFIGNGDDLFSENYYSQWSAQAQEWVDFSYIAESSAFKVTSKIDETDKVNQFTSNNRRIYLRNSTSFVDNYDGGKGFDEYNFYYYSELKSGAGDYIGFRAYALDNAGKNSIELFTVTGADLVDSEWTRLTINLKQLFQSVSPEDFHGFSLVCVGAPESSIMFRCGYFSKKPTYPVNLFGDKYQSDWKIVQPVFISTEFDENYKINRLSDESTASNHLGNKNRRIYLDNTESFRSAIKQGFTDFKFEYYSTLNAQSGYYGFQIFISTGTSSWQNQTEIARYTIENNVSHGLVSGEWTSVMIDLGEINISDYEDEARLSICVVSEKDGYILFRNASFSDSNGNIYSE